MSRKRLLKKVFYAFLLVRKGGIGILLQLFIARLYSNITYVWMAKDLDSEHAPNFDKMLFSLQPASSEDFKKVLARLNEERGQDMFEILRRVSFYERGFDACYFASIDTGEVCHMAWLLSSSHNDLIQSQYPSGMRTLADEEVLLENVFTFPKYRRKGIMLSATLQMADMARNQGFPRILAYVDVENKPSLRGFIRAGFRPYGEEIEKRRLFKIRRTRKGG